MGPLRTAHTCFHDLSPARWNGMLSETYRPRSLKTLQAATQIAGNNVRFKPLIHHTDTIGCFFLGCKANARVILAKTGHGPHSSKIVVVVVVCIVCFVLFYVLFVCKCVLPPGDNPIAVNKYIKYQTLSCTKKNSSDLDNGHWGFLANLVENTNRCFQKHMHPWLQRTDFYHEHTSQ